MLYARRIPALRLSPGRTIFGLALLTYCNPLAIAADPCLTPNAALTAAEFKTQHGPGRVVFATRRAPENAEVAVEFKGLEGLDARSMFVSCFANERREKDKWWSVPADIVVDQVNVENKNVKVRLITPSLASVFADADEDTYSIFRRNNWFRVSEPTQLRLVALKPAVGGGNEVIFARSVDFRFAYQVKAGFLSISAIAVIMSLMFVVAPAGRRFAILDSFDDRRSISLAQMLWWTLLVLFAFFYVWAIKDEFLDITPQMLVLLGIPAVSLLSAKVTAGQRRAQIPADYFQQVEQARMAADGQRRLPGWSDLLSERGRPDLFKFQLIVFSVVSGLYVLRKVVHDFAFPDVPTNLLALMGISNGAYIGNKIASEDEWNAARAKVEQAENAKRAFAAAKKSLALYNAGTPEFVKAEAELKEREAAMNGAVDEAKKAVLDVYNVP